jgi:hypothetical protein
MNRAARSGTLSASAMPWAIAAGGAAAAEGRMPGPAVAVQIGRANHLDAAHPRWDGGGRREEAQAVAEYQRDAAAVSVAAGDVRGAVAVGVERGS